MGGLRSAPTYIYRHNSSYIFRIAIPNDLTSHLNKKEFRYSLKTGSVSVAKFRARVIVSMIQTLFKDLRRGGRMAELTDKEINQIIRDYIRAYRLNLVRKELTKAAYSIGKVADIANQWGFWHMGQFAIDYKKQYGKLPSKTLKNVLNWVVH